MRVPNCVFRETVVIDRPLTIEGEPGAELRGSDVFARFSLEPRVRGPVWVSSRSAPLVFDTHTGRCPAGTACRRLAQVFRDGKALDRVPGHPGPNAFALAPDQRIVLGADPAGHTIEVGVRDRWLVLASNDVAVRGLRFRHALNPARTWAIETAGAPPRGLTLAGNHMQESVGPILALTGDGHAVTDNVVVRGGGTALTLRGGRSGLVARNRVLANNVALARGRGWRPAGVAVLDGQAIVRENVVASNVGPAIFCAGCEGTLVTGNRLLENASGIVGLAGSSMHVEGNLVRATSSEADRAQPGGGMGVVLVHTRGSVVRDNLLLQNEAGVWIGALDAAAGGQTRAACAGSANNHVVSNTLVAHPGRVMSLGGHCPGDRFERNRYWPAVPSAVVDPTGLRLPTHEAHRLLASR